MPLLSSARKAERFARLLEGHGGASSAGEFDTLQQLAARLSAVPQPRPEFASALRQQLMSQAAGTLPSAGAGLGSAGSGSAGSGSAGSGSAGGSAGGGAASGATSAASGATSAASAGSAAAGGTAAGGSAFSAIMSATAPVWAQFAAITAATAVAIGGVGLGATQSLPGDPLYGVKRQLETIRVDLAGGRTDTALAQLGLARTRLSELADLLGDRSPDAPLGAELQDRIAKLLGDWAAETSQGTTVLLEQLKLGAGDATAIRQELTDFTDAQARRLALVVQKIPDAQLQSYTGSAFAYLQRVDTALGNPVHLATLLPSLGLALPSAANPTAAPTSSPTASSGTTAPSTSGSSPNSGPSSVPTLPIPTATSSTGSQKPRSVPTVPSLPTLPSGGSSLPGPAGSTVGRTVDGVDQTVNGVLNGVTGKGPSLKLPTSVPTVSGVGR